MVSEQRESGLACRFSYALVTPTYTVRQRSRSEAHNTMCGFMLYDTQPFLFVSGRELEIKFRGVSHVDAMT